MAQLQAILLNTFSSYLFSYPRNLGSLQLDPSSPTNQQIKKEQQKNK
jgi:hypothetical protein